MRRKLLVALLALVVLAPGSAGAHVKAVADADDVAGPLDIETFTTNHTANQVIFSIATHEPWTKNDVKGPNGTIFVIIRLASPNSFLISVKTDSSGELWATLQRCTPVCSGGKLYLVDKPNGRTATFRIPRSKLTEAGQVLKLAAQTSHGTGCEGPCHMDFAPNSGWAKHDIGAAG